MSTRACIQTNTIQLYIVFGVAVFICYSILRSIYIYMYIKPFPPMAYAWHPTRVVVVAVRSICKRAEKHRQAKV